MTALLDTIDWGTRLDSRTVSYVFAPSGYSADGYTSEGVNAYEQAQMRLAFDLIEAVSGLTFLPAPGTLFGPTPDLRLLVDTNEILGAFLAYFNPPGEIAAGVGVFDGTLWDRFPGGDLEPGGYAFVTLTHEILHGLGLAHPHDDGGGSTLMEGVVFEEGQVGPYGLNQGVYTTMSYNSGWYTGPVEAQGDFFDLWGYEIGPMALDIAVLQEKYGTNPETGRGDDRYVLPTENAPGTGWRAIWDTGGADAIVHEGDAPVVIDLRPATLREEVGGGGYLSSVTDIAGGYTIAAGVLIETAIGGPGDDLLIGNAGDNTLEGGAGDDRLTGGGGRDVAVIAAPRDAVSVSRDGTAVVIEHGGESDRLSGIEIVRFSDGAVALSALLPDGAGGLTDGTPGPDRLEGSDGPDTLLGRAGNDTLLGAGGDDLLSGGIGFDRIDGGAGNDTVQGENGFDRLSGGAGNDSLEGNFGNDTLSGGSGQDSLYGGLGFDSLSGGSENDILEGRDGFDTLEGGDGADLLYGNNGNDSLLGGPGADRLEGGLGADLLQGGDGADLLFGKAGFDLLEGGAGNDRLTGGAGNDRLAGGAGNDVLIGGLGADVFVFTGGSDRITDFRPVDRIEIAAALTGLAAPVAEDLADFARVDLSGDLLLEFGEGDALRLVGVTRLDMISDAVAFV